MTGQLITTYDGSLYNSNGTIEPGAVFSGNIGSSRKPYELGNFARLWLGGSGNSGDAYARMGIINLFTGKADKFASIFPYENGNGGNYILPQEAGTLATREWANENTSPTVIYNPPWNIIPVGYFSTSTGAPYCYLLSAQVAVNNMAITQSHGSMYYRDTTINLPFTCSEVIPVVSAKPSTYKVIGTVSSWTGSSVTVTAMCPMSATVNMTFMLSIFARTTNKIT